MKANQEIGWLLEGDPAIQFFVHKDLLHSGPEVLNALQARIATEGWGAAFLARRNPSGHWGRDFYQPKWTSTHYTLLDLKNLGMPPTQPACGESVRMYLRQPEGSEGGINIFHSTPISDVCVNGMILNFAAWFTPGEKRLESLTDYLLDMQMKDGGWNCAYFKGHTHSSVHSTLSVLEGLLEFSKSGNPYREKEIVEARKKGEAFLLLHRLFRSHRTGEVIDPKMLLLSYPGRWRYDVLRALDYFRAAEAPFDPRMQDAINVLLKKKGKDGRWPLQGKHPGQVHFDMERNGEPSRWNTVRALRVLAYFS